MNSQHKENQLHEAPSDPSPSTLNSCDEILLGEAGFDPPFVSIRLTTGRNNQVYRVTDRNRRQVILKRYFHHDNDQRNRLDHEWRFLAYASKHTPNSVPAPLFRNPESQVALFEFVPGETYQLEPSEKEVREAIDFIVRLNRKPNSEACLPDAADACFQASDHIGLLQKRINRLQVVKDPEVGSFVSKSLAPNTQTVIESFTRFNVGTRRSNRIISPSDFGFHNAIRRADGGGTCFLDFEYAGWDSAEKLIADFFSQPDIAISECFLPEFLRAMETIIASDSHQNLVRCLPSLLALHALKWCSILLNDFIPTDLQRRHFSGKPSSGKLQLEKAQAYFQTVCLPRMQNLRFAS